jgi:ParB/RepB/Spo0J family partition protein
MQLDPTLLQSNVKPKNKEFGEDELLALEEAALKSKYPSEINNPKPAVESGDVTISINPSETRLWKGNPRNFSFHSDLSLLVSLIKQTKGNVTPVVGRRLPVKDVNGIEIEIIAGSRRRSSCIEACEELKVTLVDVDDEQAKLIAEAENKGRKDTDLFTDCRYIKSIYDEMKVADPQLTVETFANLQVPKQTRQTMNDRLKLAVVPLWIQKPVQDPDAWSFRKGLRLKSVLNDKSLDLEALEASLANQTFAKPDNLLTYIADFIGIVKANNDIEITVNDQVVSISEQKSGMTKIVLPKGAGKLREEIEKLIRNFSNT